MRANIHQKYIVFILCHIKYSRRITVDLRQGRNTPVDPISLGESEVGPVRPEDRRICRLIEQEPVDERVQLRLLGRWELAVVVVANLRVAHPVGNAQRLVDQAPGRHAPVRGHISQPLLRRVLDDK